MNNRLKYHYLLFLLLCFVNFGALTAKDYSLITDSLELSVSEIIGVNCSSNGLGSITLRGVGGVFPYYYSIDNQNFTTDSVFQAPAGSTNAWVRDAVGCEANLINIVVHVEDPLVASISGPNNIVDPGEIFQIQLTVNRPSDSVMVDWQPDSLIFCHDCLTINTSMRRTDTIFAIVSDFFGCEETLSWSVEVEVYHDLYIPNAFSPNNDGINDIFQIHSGFGVSQILSFKVFNRWGAILHDSPESGWDGIFKGKIMDGGTYTWLAEVAFLDGEVELFGGSVLLVR